MKHKGKFQKVSAAAKRMYGPRVILVCGYPQDEHEPFLSFLKKTKVADFPVVFAVQTDLERKVGEIIDQEHKSGFLHSSPMPRAVIMSGVTGKEMNSLMQGYRKARFPLQLWASLTPTSEAWTLQELLSELEVESRAMRGKKGS
ncbi:DUF3783 domain-containing protein [Desulfovermiculus halophilus]|jgi:hypothetical protein|uniref:DUF3783 domain-containing protein n=1 Tax=Desulfovermiculus halophilus TaxID=339722 RepID=UPI00048784EA|nr:DUF3783 domain-containing protein [Desulfovermiculus halophilus]